MRIFSSFDVARIENIFKPNLVRLYKIAIIHIEFSIEHTRSGLQTRDGAVKQTFAAREESVKTVRERDSSAGTPRARHSA